jgi:preprotein translocase subunit SecA
MDYLREGIHLRGFAQEDPLVAYKNEAYNMFGGLIQSLWEEFARYIFNVEIEIQEEQPTGNGQMWQPPTGSSSTGNLQYAGGGPDQPSALAAAAAAGGAAGAEYYADEQPVRVEQFRREEPKVGRNDPCPCGSGKKYKKCHGADAFA